jgi:hypothetical protein
MPPSVPSILLASKLEMVTPGELIVMASAISSPSPNELVHTTQGTIKPQANSVSRVGLLHGRLVRRTWAGGWEHDCGSTNLTSPMVNPTSGSVTMKDAMTTSTVPADAL